MNSTSRAVIVGALALPLTFAASDLASAGVPPVNSNTNTNTNVNVNYNYNQNTNGLFPAVVQTVFGG
jgi:hypothetical protein